MIPVESFSFVMHDLQILHEKKPHPKDTQPCSVLSRQAYRCKVLQCLLSLRLKRRTR